MDVARVDLEGGFGGELLSGDCRRLDRVQTTRWSLEVFGIGTVVV